MDSTEQTDNLIEQIPCKCGISFDLLPFELHPKSNIPVKVVWNKLRGDNPTQTVQLHGNVAGQAVCLSPGDWDMFYSSSSGYKRHRISLTNPLFKMCSGYSPDNLKYLEMVYDKSQCKYI